MRMRLFVFLAICFLTSIARASGDKDADPKKPKPAKPPKVHSVVLGALRKVSRQALCPVSPSSKCAR